MLDIEGLHGLGELSLVGSEAEVTEGIAAIAESGATDFTAVPMGSNPDEVARTREILRIIR
jgi:5,10-methylenetetrahydromethanopterin reductase